MDKDYEFKEVPSNNYLGKTLRYLDDNIDQIDYLVKQLRSLVYIEEDKLIELQEEFEQKAMEVKTERDSYENTDEEKYEELDEEYWNLEDKLSAIEDMQEYINNLSEVL